MSEKGKMLTTTINIMGQIDPSLQKTIADTQKRIKKLAPALWSAIIKTESPSARKYGKIGLHEEEFRWRENTAKRNGRRR